MESEGCLEGAMETTIKAERRPALKKKVAYSIAIIGATGAVGKETLEIMEERSFSRRRAPPVCVEALRGRTSVLREGLRRRAGVGGRGRPVGGGHCLRVSHGRDQPGVVPEDRRGGRDCRRRLGRLPDGPGRAARRARGERGRAGRSQGESSPSRTARRRRS